MVMLSKAALHSNTHSVTVQELRFVGTWIEIPTV